MQKVIELPEGRGRVQVKIGRDPLMESSVAGRIFFLATSNKELTYNDVLKVQELSGYHYMGYDFPKNIQRQNDDGTFGTSWSCSACSD